MNIRRVKSKYGSHRVQVNGHTFSSKAESKRYQELLILERAGDISDLTLQPKFELAPSVKFPGAAKATPALRYFADFSYHNHRGELVVEDVKGGPTTEGFRIKKHLMLAIHGIVVQEVRMR